MRDVFFFFFAGKFAGTFFQLKLAICGSARKPLLTFPTPVCSRVMASLKSRSLLLASIS